MDEDRELVIAAPDALCAFRGSAFRPAGEPGFDNGALYLEQVFVHTDEVRRDLARLMINRCGGPFGTP